MAVKNSLVKKKSNNIADVIRSMDKQFEAALPKHITSERFMRVVLTEIRKNPKLAECDKASLLGALMTSAQLGLEPGVLGQAYLIPYKNSCQFQISYKGMIELLRRTGQLASIYSYVVYEKDEFEVSYGLERNLIHRPAKGDRGEVIGYYSVAKLNDNNQTVEFEYMTKDEVEAHAKKFSMAYSKGYDSPWKSSFDAMAKKTVIKQMLKMLPVSVEALNISSNDDAKFVYNENTGETERVGEINEAEKFEDVENKLIEAHNPETGEIIEKKEEVNVDEIFA